MSLALGKRFPGVQVADVQLLGTSAATNLHLRLGLTYAEQAGAPDTVFVKLPPLDPGNRVAIGATGMGLREARFYADIASSMSMRVPDAYFAEVADDGSFLLLLEDLSARGCRISDGTWGVPGALAGRALEELADLHVRFQDAAERARAVPWATVKRQVADTRLTTLRAVIDDHHDILTPDYVAVGEMYITHHAELDALWDSGPQTLIHGDAHIGNVFIDDDRVGFLDWGMTTVSSPLRDVSYFLTMAVDTEDRRRMQRDLLQHYLDVRRSLGGSEITFEDAWMSHRVLAGYTVLASFLGLVPPYNDESGYVFATTFRERSYEALEDLETVDALRQVLA
jgi:hypothetical protein